MSNRVKQIMKNALEGFVQDSVSEIPRDFSERQSVIQVEEINNQNSMNVISESVSMDLIEPGKCFL